MSEEIASNIICQIESEQDSIKKSLENINGLLVRLHNVSSEGWDWISVRKASELYGVSVTSIYDKINSRQLSAKRFGAKIFVKASEVGSVNDK